MAFKLERVSTEPRLTPRKNVHWEQDAALNAAAIFEDGGADTIIGAAKGNIKEFYN